jgi:hypothetical protein
MVQDHLPGWHEEAAKGSGPEWEDYSALVTEGESWLNQLHRAVPTEPLERELRTTNPELLRSLVNGDGEDALSVLSDDRGDPLERREALRRLRVSATILERMEGVA